MTKKQERIQRIAKIIREETGWYNGWLVNEEAFVKTSEKAARRIARLKGGGDSEHETY